MYYYLIEIATISALVSIFYKCYQLENKRFNKKREKREKREKKRKTMKKRG